jgi:ligand-binding SRPBCC domain-containing protein
MSWKTRILIWRPPHEFIDVQERGPYRIWQHTHTFEAVGEGTRMTDTLRYMPPFGPLGSVMRILWIKRDLEAIFDYRRQKIEEIFAGKNNLADSPTIMDQPHSRSRTGSMSDPA